MPIKIILAEPHGFCGNSFYGVKRAIKKVISASKKNNNSPVYLLGEVVHNPHVVAWLEKKYQVKTVFNIKDIPEGATVVIRAHGATPTIYQKIRTRKLKLVDATCPLVKNVHQQVKRLAKKGKTIIYLASKKDHDEALGVWGEAPKSVIITTLKELNTLKIKNQQKTFVLTQTTLSTIETEKVLSRFKKKYPKATVFPHICPATTKRQKAVISLAKKTGLVVIVGHKSSSNSNRLREVAEKVGAQSYLVNREEDLKPDWFLEKKEVVVSSGASTPEWLLKRIINKIKTISR